jgi:hypothetical protein
MIGPTPNRSVTLEPEAATAVRIRLCDALSFAVATLPARARKTAWIVVDDGLLAPEDLPKLFDRLAA